jgi:hypothetical protein
MQVSELFDIEPSHTDVNETSRRRLDYGDGWAPVGYATLWMFGRVVGASLGDCETFRISGVRGERLLVLYQGGYTHGREHGPNQLLDVLRGRRQRYFWVDAGMFPDGIEMLAKVRKPMPERYWHPNWQGINALPPANHQLIFAGTS